MHLLTIDSLSIFFWSYEKVMKVAGGPWQSAPNVKENDYPTSSGPKVNKGIPVQAPGDDGV